MSDQDLKFVQVLSGFLTKEKKLNQIEISNSSKYFRNFRLNKKMVFQINKPPHEEILSKLFVQSKDTCGAPMYKIFIGCTIICRSL